MIAPAFAAAALAVSAAGAAAAPAPRVDLDARLELIGAVSWLSAPKRDAAADPLASLPYARALARRLPVPADPALTAPLAGPERARLALSVSPLPELRELDGGGASGAEEARLAALRAYARDAKFAAAFDAVRYRLDADAAAARRRLAAAAPLRALEDYTGLQGPERAEVLLSPFADPGPAPGLVELLDDGSASLTLVVGPAVSTAPALDFWSERLPEALWNESAQLQLEPLLSLYAGRVAQSSKLAASDARCAGDWTRCAADQLARAVSVRLTARRDGEAAAAAFRSRLEGGKRSPVLAAFLSGLVSYEASRRGRKAVPGLDAFFPRLLAFLPLDDPSAAPAPAALPPAASVSPRKRRRLAAFLTAAARRAADPRLKALAAAAPSWAESPGNDVSAPAPDDPRKRGLEDFAAGRKEAALADFRAALSSAPDDAQTLASEAAVLESLGRDEEALAAYGSAIEAARAPGAPPRLLSDLLSSREDLRRRVEARKAAARRGRR